MQAILAIDSGGTKTDALLVGLDGERLGYGRSQSSGRFTNEDESGGFGRTETSLREAVSRAVPEPARYEGYHLGLSGGPPVHVRGALTLRELSRTIVMEFEPCRTMWHHSFGMVALAGTGAFAFGTNPAGVSLRLDGMGPFLGDYGSGFSIGLRAIQAVACSHWSPRRATSLEGAILESAEGSLDVHQPAKVLPYLDVRHRSRIAALAALVDREARRGDRIAESILLDGAKDLSETVRDLADQLELGAESCDLIGCGSVLMKSDIYWNAFVRCVAERVPRALPRRMPYPPVVGVALQVLARLGGEGAAAARDRLLSDVRNGLTQEKP